MKTGNFIYIIAAIMCFSLIVVTNNYWSAQNQLNAATTSVATLQSTSDANTATISDLQAQQAAADAAAAAAAAAAATQASTTSSSSSGSSSSSSSSSSSGSASTSSSQVFTTSELAQYDGTNGMPVYVASDGVVYDVTNESTFQGAMHYGYDLGGKDISSMWSMAPHGKDVLNGVPVVGTLQ